MPSYSNSGGIKNNGSAIFVTYSLTGWISNEKTFASIVYFLDCLTNLY